MEIPNLSPEVEPSPDLEQPPADELTDVELAESATPSEPPPSYVKLAMRNMVKKRGLSLQHFFLTMIGLLVTFVGLAYLTR